MRLVLLFAMSAALGISARNNIGVADTPPTELTIVLDFEGQHAEESIVEMKRETASILKPAGFLLDWHLRDEVGHSSYANLVLVKLRGECLMDPSLRSHPVRGPLASSHTTRTKVMPFADIRCDAVSSLVGPADSVIFGRALGRVLSHELWHILGNTFAHAENGIAQRALSAEQLVSGRLDLDPADLERFRFWRTKWDH
jgi:hypothetical protein